MDLSRRMSRLFTGSGIFMEDAEYSCPSDLTGLPLMSYSAMNR